MKSFFRFFWRVAIPMLWLVSVLAAFQGGFQPGYVPPPPPGQSYPYPWLGLIFTSVLTGIESAFLYLILRPHRFTWSIPRVGFAFVMFLILSLWAIYTIATDQPGYAYVPGQFTVLLAALLFILLIITVIVVLAKLPKPKARVT